MGAGRLQGGWEYVWAAYGIAWASLSLYALSLWLRRPARGRQRPAGVSHDAARTATDSSPSCALLVAGAGLALVAFGNIGENLVYYWRPSEMLAQGEKAYGPTIRLGGVVQPGSIQWDEQHTTLTFRVADSATARRGPACWCAPPRCPRRCSARASAWWWRAPSTSRRSSSSSRLMVNHSNEYRAPKTGDDVKKMFEDMQKQEATTGRGEDSVNGTLGYGLVLGGLAFASFGALVGLVSRAAPQRRGLPVGAARVYGFFACMLGANLVMVYALLTHDFSVKYVAQVGSRATPTIFTIVSLWSALEGSILFWGAHHGRLRVRLRAGRTSASTRRYMSAGAGHDAGGGRLLRLPHRRAGQPVPRDVPGAARTGRAPTRCCRTTS